MCCVFFCTCKKKQHYLKYKCSTYLYYLYFQVFVVVIFFHAALCRFISLLDSVLPHLVPAWDYSLGTFNHIKVRHCDFKKLGQGPLLVKFSWTSIHYFFC